MTNSRAPGRCRGGFTLLELLLVVVCLGILATLAAPKVRVLVARSKVNQAATVIAADLEQSLTLAGRRRRPMVLAVESPGIYTVRDRATAPNDTVRLRRHLAIGPDAGVSTLAFSVSTAQIFPNGTLAAPLTVTVSGAGHTRTVSVTAAGQVRVTP